MRQRTLTRLDSTLLPRQVSASRRFLGAVCVVFVVGLNACGPTTPDNDAGRGPEASKTATSIAQAVRQGNTGGDTNQGQGPAGENNAAAKSDVLSEKPESRGREVPGVPELVLKDLASGDPGTRLRALDHWTSKETAASLEPVFEALEDENDAVRARAAAVIEQQWTIEQEKEKS